MTKTKRHYSLGTSGYGGSYGYAGGRYDEQLANWLASSTSADAEIYSSLRALRNRSRQLMRDNDYILGGKTKVVDNVIGAGIGFQSQVPLLRGAGLNVSLNDRIETAFAESCQADNFDPSGQLDRGDLERLILGSVVESGEVFVRIVRQQFGSFPVPLAFEIIESDLVVEDYNSHSRQDGRYVRMGIEYNEWNRPTGYYFYPNHPGDYNFAHGSGRNWTSLRYIPASDIIHIFEKLRPGQSRGAPWIFSTMIRSRNLSRFEEAELRKALVQSLVTGAIQKLDVPTTLEDTDEEQELISDLYPGSLLNLQPGESFTGFAPTSPSGTYEPFVKMQLRAQAIAFGLSYETYSNDYSNTSFSSARTSLTAERINFQRRQQWMIKLFCNRVFKEWLNLAQLSGAISIPGYERNPSHFFKPDWQPRGWPWIDPRVEIEASLNAVEGGLSSLTTEARKQGKNFEEIIEERKREKAELEAAGLSSSAYPSANSQQPDLEEESKESEESEDFEPIEGLTPVRIFPQLTSIREFYRKKKCTLGLSCGNSCISKKKTCRLNLSRPDRDRFAKLKAKLSFKLIQKEQNELTALQEKAKIEKKSESKQEDSSFITQEQIKNTSDESFSGKDYSPRDLLRHKKNLFDLADRKGDSRSLEEQERDDAILMELNNNDAQIKKVQRGQDAGLTEIEAHGLAQWLNHDYKPINEALVRPDGGERYAQGMAVGTQLQKALLKLPAPTNSEIEADLKKHAYIPHRDEEGNIRLIRSVRISDNQLDSFLAPYKSAVGQAEYREPAFLATSYIPLGYEGNVQYHVKPRLDGKGQSVAVDKYKNEAFEAEVLYPVGARFKVKEVRDNRGINKVPDDLLPSNPDYKVQREVKQVYETLYKAEGYKDISPEASDYFLKSVGYEELPGDAEMQRLKVDSGIAAQEWRKAHTGPEIEIVLEEL